MDGIGRSAFPLVLPPDKEGIGWYRIISRMSLGGRLMRREACVHLHYTGLISSLRSRSTVSEVKATPYW